MAGVLGGGGGLRGGGRGSEDGRRRGDEKELCNFVVVFVFGMLVGVIGRLLKGGEEGHY